MIRSLRTGRPPHRRESLVAELRRRIVNGELAPGSRLPSRQALMRQFNSAIPTVQDAVQRLVRDGFVETQGTRGTFVANRPPHLCAYGLVFPKPPIESRFFRALRRAAEIVFDSESRRLRLYHSDPSHASDPSNEQLFDDVANHRIAGTIVIWPGPSLSHSRLFQLNRKVPGVVFWGAATDWGAPSLDVDVSAFFERAVDRLLALGRRKIAHIGPGSDQLLIEHLPQLLQRRGLEYRPAWHHRLGTNFCTAAENVAQLLMSLAPADRPDGLIISDDNLVEHAQKGLAAIGARVPQDLQVVAHCNWPEPSTAILPLIRLGFDCVSLMHAATQLIDQQRRGEATPPIVRFAPVFEEEVPANVPAASVIPVITSVPE